MADPIRTVRLLIPDLDVDDQIMSDEEITDLLEVWNANPLRAAASALLAISTDSAKLLKMSTDDLSVDGAAVALQLRENAKMLFAQADAADGRVDDEAFTLVYPEYATACPPEATPWPFVL